MIVPSIISDEYKWYIICSKISHCNEEGYLSYNGLTSWKLFTGGIIGLGEAEEDRVGLLHTLSTLPTHPESVPINALVAVKGTPLENQKVNSLSSWIIKLN